MGNTKSINPFFPFKDGNGNEIEYDPTIKRVVDDIKEAGEQIKFTCSFCGRLHTNVEILIVAQNRTTICSDCVTLASDMIKEKREELKIDKLKQENKIKEIQEERATKILSLKSILGATKEVPDYMLLKLVEDISAATLELELRNGSKN